jgi:hypothetical protein
MSLSQNKILVANVLTNQPGSYFLTTTVSSVGSGNATTMSNAQFIPAGEYVYLPTANVTIEFNIGTSGNNTWTTWIAANTAGVIVSDGWNVRANATTGTQTVTLYTPNGGQAATQSTFATS